MGGRMPARRRRRINTIWLVVAALLVGLAATVGALGGSTERVTRMWVGARIADDGSARITEVIDYDFGVGFEDRHGIYRDVPGLSPDGADVTVTSDSAPAKFLLLADRIRIGDPDQRVYGRHQYRIEYTLKDVAPNGKLAWDAVGTGWQVDADVVKIHVVAPFALDGVRCVQGAEGSISPCPMSRPSPGEVIARVTKLAPGKGVTVYADAGNRLAAMAAPPSESTEALGGDTGTGPNPLLPGLLAAAAALLVTLAVARVLRILGRERVGGRRVELEDLPLTPTPTPPDGLTPAQGGILLAERVQPQHKVAWLMTTALDGHLHIDDDEYRPTLTRAAGPVESDDLAVNPVLDRIFAGRDSVTLGSYHPDLKAAWDLLGSRLTWWWDDSGLPNKDAELRHLRVRLAGFALLALGVVAAIAGGVLSGGIGSSWLPTVVAGAVLAGAGFAMVLRGWELRVRTERGTALWIEVESFRRYLADASRYPTARTVAAEQVERYTAWAVALGEVERWSEAVKRSTVAR
ncbi:DUF2207 domain-containing protein [Micromonospora sp. CPCC 206061]|uniref:DUF2207 domain-containing protein n=1 Tax=Micromonospora sp. CPCC 206061 TaxID=3122410 RepID=UPI002FEE8DEB